MSRKLIFRTLAVFIFIAFSISLPSVSFAQEDKWTTKADMPTPRFALSSSVVDGKIYAISGRKAVGGQFLAVVEEYDPETDTWTKKADIPTARSEFSTSVVDGKIYAIGGWTRENNRPVVEVYDPETDKWTKKADMPIMHVWSATSAVDGKIYAIGGVGGVSMGLAGPTIMMVEEYDPATDTWVRKADMPTARAMLSACAVNGKIYAIGGHFWDSAWQGTTLSAVEEYDPATDTWTKKADMPMPTYGHATTVVNGKIYVMGGTWGEGADTTQVNRVTILSTIMKYDPATDTWTKEGDMRVPRTAMSASVVDGRIYVIGGQEVDVRGISTVEAYQPDTYPADGAESVDLNVKLSWTAGLGAALYTVYFGDNFDDVNNATGGFYQGATTYTPGPLEFAKTYYWRVDELGLGRGGETHKGDIWSFTTQGAVGNPEPANGAVDVTQTPVLSWNPGVLAASHEVYFGTDEEAVKNADTGSPEYKGTSALGDEILDPGKLTFDTTYYWRVDEVNNTNPDSPWVGNLWSFTTADFNVVDDFEDYDIGNNEIWWAWKDGSGYASHPTEPPYAGNGTGSMVGDESTGSYTEEIRVHEGSQTMPYWYDNNKMGFLKYSEATLTLTYPRDWTENGVNTLTIWFHGDPANAAEPMYVALNVNAVAYHDNPNAAQTTLWTEWRIDLQEFADQGVDLTNVNTIALGFGDRNNPQPGGKGLMLFDDIRLYRP